jgi:hypothetical protein
MPMLASARSGLPGIAGGSAGFSTNSRMRRCASMCMTPKAVASMRGTSMQPTVHSAPVWRCMATWSASIRA